jgi:uncharacterized membrane protein YdfJ with MMPL/SSD domain
MNKRIAPTIVVIIVGLYILVQAGVILYLFRKEGLGLFWIILIALIPLGIAVTLLAVYLERIREIKDEEEDDLSKY